MAQYVYTLLAEEYESLSDNFVSLWTSPLGAESNRKNAQISWYEAS